MFSCMWCLQNPQIPTEFKLNFYHKKGILGFFLASLLFYQCIITVHLYGLNNVFVFYFLIKPDYIQQYFHMDFLFNLFMFATTR